MSCEIREILTDDQKRDCYRLRYEIYINEMGRQQKYVDHEQMTIAEPEDEGSVIFGAYDENERLVGTVRAELHHELMPDGEAYGVSELMARYPGEYLFVAKLMVLKDYRSRTVFVDLAKACYSLALRRKIQFAVINCNDHLVPIFKRLGFVQMKAPFQHPEFGVVNPMAIEVFNAKHLRAQRSAFWKLLSLEERNATMTKLERIIGEWEPAFYQANLTPGFARIMNGEIEVIHYAAIMRQIFHHARENPQLQAYATAYFKGNQRKMCRMFFSHASSEIGHDQLAKEDLITLGVDVSGLSFERPLPATSALLAFPFYQIQFHNVLGYLGYLFHLEFMPTRMGAAYMESLAKAGVPREAMSFIADHATIDIAHNKLMERYIDELILTEEDMETVIYCAKVTAKLYANMVQEAIELADRVKSDSTIEKIDFIYGVNHREQSFEA